MTKERLVVLSGAGVSAESGIQTFRGAGGMWGQHRVDEVASPAGWADNPEVVCEFYNHRIDEMSEAEPNEAHKILAELEEVYDIEIFTQNVDGLHEAAGSSSVHHLHGSIAEKRNVIDGSVVPLESGERFGPEGDGTYLYRQNIVWFGEKPLHLDIAASAIRAADKLVVVGTSLKVFPAAALPVHASDIAHKIFVDPNASSVAQEHADLLYRNRLPAFRFTTLVDDVATSGLRQLVDTSVL